MKISNFYLIIFGLGITSLCSLAQAQDTTTVAQGTYGQLSALSDKIAILKAQAQITKLQEEISTNKRGADSSMTTSSRIQTYNSATKPTFYSNANNAPYIISISGRGRRLSTILQMPQGAQVEAFRGTTLQNGMTVESITPTSVQVIKNNEIFFLPFAGVEINSNNTQPGD